MLRDECKGSSFKLGVNFDTELLSEIIKLNSKSEKNKITELYGSDANHFQLAARPKFRLPNIDENYLEKYVKIAKENGIDFNYTMNSFMPYVSKVSMFENLNDTIDFIHFLESIGVYRITIANPLMLEIIRKYAKSDIEIELSTCAHIDTISQIKYYHEVYGVNKICGNLNKNRDFNFLERAAEYCNKNGIIYELMANEFCGVGGEGYATHCIYRDSCYMCHATNESYEDSILFDNYPMSICTMSRNKDKANWLKLRFIRPEDIKVYNEIGLKHFKITGRTGSTEYIIKTIASYLNESYEGNLLGLWKQLESIKPGVNEKDVETLFIDNKKLDGFIDVWSVGRKVCDYEVCGETCNYCSKFYQGFVEE